MEIIQKSLEDIVTPDQIIINSLNISLRYSKNKNNSLSFDGEYIYVSDEIKPRSHPYIHSKTKKYDTFDLRYWPEAKLLSAWIDGDIIERLTSLKQAFKEGKIKNLNGDIIESPINIDDVMFIFVEEIDYEECIVKCKLDEIDDSHIIVQNDNLRLFHLLSPTAKAKELRINKKLQEAKHHYYLMYKRSWISKHGHIDPALYHLIMYEE